MTNLLVKIVLTMDKCKEIFPFVVSLLLCCQPSFSLTKELSGYAKMRYTWNEEGQPQTNLGIQDVRLMNKLTISKLSTLVLEINATSQISVKSCYIQLKLDKGTLQFGQFKIPFGYEIPLPAALLETPTIATVLGKLFPNQTYDIGLKWTPTNYLQLAIINGTGENAKDNNNAKDLLLRLANGKKNFTYGASFYLGKQRMGNGDVVKNRWGVDLLLNGERNVVVGEIIWGKDGEENSKGWYIKYRYNLPSTSYVIKYQYYDGVSSFDAKMGKWKRMEEKALILGPMFYLDKNTILSFMYTLSQSNKNKDLTLQLEVIY